MNPISKFFLFCSGADIDTLRSKECHIEQDKYAGIGITVLVTGILASLSGGYALFTIFRSSSLAILFGGIWGGMIFNLDRSVVQSIRKTKSDEKQFLIIVPGSMSSF